MTLHLISQSDLPPCGVTPPLSGGSDKPATNAEPKTQTPTPQAKAGKGKTDLYQTVTDSIIRQLEAGAVPWVQPWGRPDSETPFRLPTNGDTGNTYSGVNILLLWGAAIETSLPMMRSTPELPRLEAGISHKCSFAATVKSGRQGLM